MKSCSFLHAHFFELMKVVENLFKKKLMVIPMCTYNIIMLLKIRKKLFGNLLFPSIMSIVFTSFKHPKLPISIKIPVTLL